MLAVPGICLQDFIGQTSEMGANDTAAHAN